MLLSHVGVINNNREDALRFYKDFLGLELTRETLVSRELSEQLFAVSRDVAMPVFEDIRDFSGNPIEIKQL